MSTMSLRLPDSIHKRLKEWAQKDDTSINQLITTAVAEKLAALSTLDYLASRAKRSSKEQFNAVLAGVPDVPAQPEDVWPPTRRDL
jgi:predicted DNA-binding ribbon-helix-helix protein